MHERGKTRVPHEISTHEVAAELQPAGLQPAGLQPARYRDSYAEQGYLVGFICDTHPACVSNIESSGFKMIN